MKKILALSLVTSVSIFAASSVTNLQQNQVNVTQNSSLSNGTTAKQGTTELTNATVNNVSIDQTAGNLIDNSTLSGTNSIINQGVSSVSDSTLNNADLNSKNEIKRVNITGGSSTVIQLSLIHI